MRGGTRGGGRGFSTGRTIGTEQNGYYESNVHEKGDTNSIDLSQFDDIGVNCPIQRVRPKEPHTDTFVKSDYDSQRNLRKRISEMTLFEKLFIAPIRIDYELDETAAEEVLGPEAIAELRSRSAWGIQPDKYNKYRRQIEKVPDERINFIIKTLIVNGSPTNISFRNGIPYSDGSPSYPSESSFPTIQQLNDNSKLPHVGLVFIPSIFHTESTLDALINDIENVSEQFNNIEMFDETRHGTHRIIGEENMKLFRENTTVFNSIIDHISTLFDVDVRQVRWNRYESNEPKPAHQDAPAVMGSRAELDQNITIALTLGGTPRAVEFSPLLNEGDRISLQVSSGDIYAFTQAVNLSFTHAVEKSKKDDTSPRYSIIIWGKANSVEQLPDPVSQIENVFNTNPELFTEVETCIFGAKGTGRRFEWNQFFQKSFIPNPFYKNVKEIWSNYYLKDISPEDCLSGLSITKKTDPVKELTRLAHWCKTLEMKYYLAFNVENGHRLVLKSESDDREITRIACHCLENPKWVQLKFTKLDNKNYNAGKRYIDCNCERPSQDHVNGEFWPSCGLFIFESELLWSGFHNIGIYEEQCIYNACESKLVKAVVDENLLNGIDDFYCSYQPEIGELYWACQDGHLNGPYECKCLNKNVKENEFGETIVTPMRYVNPHFGCPHEICYMKPKLMKEHIEWVFGGCDPSQIEKFRTDSSGMENSSTRAASNQAIQNAGELVGDDEAELEILETDEKPNIENKENTPPCENLEELQVNETDNDVNSSIFSQSTNKVPESTYSHSRIRSLENPSMQLQPDSKFGLLQPEIVPEKSRFEKLQFEKSQSEKSQFEKLQSEKSQYQKSEFELQSDSASSATGDSGGRIADISSIGDISDISKLSLESSSTLPRCHCNLKTKIDTSTNKSCICANPLGSRCDFTKPLNEKIARFPE